MGALFFDRPLWHHVVLLFLPSIVVSTAIFGYFRDRQEIETGRDEDLRIFLSVVGIPVCSVVVIAFSFGLVLAFGLGSLLFSPMALFIASLLAAFIAPVVGFAVGAGAAVGYVTVAVSGKGIAAAD